MKYIIPILFMLSTMTMAKDNSVLFTLEDSKYTLNNFKLPQENLTQNSYDKNIKIIKDFAKNKLILNHIIKPSQEYKNLNIDKALNQYAQHSGHKVTEIEEMAITMHLWKKEKFNSYIIDNETVENYYNNNQEEFFLNPSIKAYYILCKDKEDLKKVTNAINYTYDIKTTIFKLASERNNGKSPSLGWRDKNGFYNTFYNNDIFPYLYSLKKKDFSKKELFIPQVNKYVFFYVENKKEGFTRPLKLAYNDIVIKLKNKLFTREIISKFNKLGDIKPVFNAEYIREISKK